MGLCSEKIVKAVFSRGVGNPWLALDARQGSRALSNPPIPSECPVQNAHCTTMRTPVYKYTANEKAFSTKIGRVGEPKQGAGEEEHCS